MKKRACTFVALLALACAWGAPARATADPKPKNNSDEEKITTHT